MREWFETRLLIPFLPLAFDILIRWLVLNSRLLWWQIPDLRTLSITTSFFCLLLAMDLKSADRLPGDEERQRVLTRLRKRFIGQGIVSAIIFGAAAAIDVSDRYHREEELTLLVCPALVSVVIVMLLISLADAIIADIKYKLSYNV